MVEAEQCNASECGQPACASLQLRSLCRKHFLTACYEQLEWCTRRLQERPTQEGEIESVRQFIGECVRQSTDIAQNATDLDNLERAQLLDVLLWAGELTKKLRRSPRKPIRIPVRLSSEKPGRAWEEETETQLLSRYGAMLECERAIDTGEDLEIVRLDTGQRAPARVVWHRRRGPQRFEVGIALRTPENFWNFR